MGHEDRQRLEPCGCRVDAPTGLVTAFCNAHKPREPKAAPKKWRPVDSEQTDFENAGGAYSDADPGL